VNTLQRLAGVWRLASSEMRDARGNVFYPLGEDCQGLLVLTAQGTLSAQIMRSDRPEFASGDMLAATPEEIVAAYQGFVSFWGEYEIDVERQTLSYAVHGSLFPNWIGHRQVRHFEFQGSQLTLRTETLLVAGEEMVGVLVWQRAAAGDVAWPN